jgi:hypothetical protein
MTERLTELRSLLTSSQYGWKLSLITSGKGAYGFYVDFNEDMTCSLVGDLTAETSSTLGTSTYRVIWAMNASLVFDTFNYVTMLQEPSSSYGGTAPNGYSSDIEFEYLKSSGDSIYMRGKKYLNEMVLVKATAAEKTAYLDDILNTLKTSVDSYFATHFNNYITIDGIANKIDIAFSNANKTFTLQFVNSEGTVESYTGKFNYEPAGLNFAQKVVVNGVDFVRATIQNDLFTLYDSTGKSYVIQQNSSPIMPIESLYGYNKVYKVLGTPEDDNVLPIVNIESTFPQVLQNTITRFGTVRLRHFTFRFEGINKMNINVFYYSTSNFTATMTVDYTYEDGILTLSNPTGNTSGNWNTRRTVLRELEDYILNNSSYRVDWVPNDLGIPVVGWYSIDNPNNIIYSYLMN